MATPNIVSVRDFNTSRWSQLGDTSTANIGDILARAERAIQSKMQRPIIPTQYTERYRPHSSIIYLEKRPVISIETFTRRYTTYSLGADVVDYYLDKETGVIESSWVIGSLVDIVYTAGFEEVPEDIKEAILIQAAYFTFQDLEIYGSGDAKEPGIMYLKDDINDLLAPYKQIHTAFTR